MDVRADMTDVQSPGLYVFEFRTELILVTSIQCNPFYVKCMNVWVCLIHLDIHCDK